MQSNIHSIKGLKFLLTKKTSRAGKFEYYIIIYMKILDWHHVCQSHDPPFRQVFTFVKDLTSPFFVLCLFCFTSFFHIFFWFPSHLDYCPGHCPDHPRVIARVMALPWPVEFSIFFLTNSNVSAFLYFCHRVQEFLCDTTR